MKTIFFFVLAAAIGTTLHPYTKLVNPPEKKTGYYKSAAGHDSVSFGLHEWDLLAGDTKYKSNNLTTGRTIAIYIEIANKTNGSCRKGIGFGCSIFDDLRKNKKPKKIVDSQNRFAAASLIKTHQQSIALVFKDSINWESLEVP